MLSRLVVCLAALALVLAFSYKRLFPYLPCQLWTQEIIYGAISDLRHPTLDDYHLIQKFLEKGKRPELKLLKDMQKRVRNFQIVEGSGKQPVFDVIHVNSDGSKKENCVIAYASCNKNFLSGLKRLIDAIVRSDYKGDILYRFGGWPNSEEGDLTLAHVPYAFKVSFFREAKRLGYARVLWLDTSILPVVSLNEIFAQIKGKGYFVMGNSHFVGSFFNELSAKALGVTLEDSFHIPSCSAGLFGVDFSHEKSREAIDAWYRAAKDPYAFFSARSDQNALSVILYKLGMREWARIEQLAEGKEKISAETLFLIDRSFVREGHRPVCD